jgi:cytochrome P450
MNAQPRSPIPSHVPPEDVLDYDFVRGPEIMADPPSALDGIRERRRYFYSSLYGGFWVFTRYDDIRAAFQDPSLLKQNEGVPRMPYGRKFIPLRLDPPEHIGYRRIMTPIFAPKQIAKMEDMIREVARRRLRDLGPRGEMEFVSEFALALPAAMFCALSGVPLDQFDMVNELSHELIYRPHEVAVVDGPEAAKRVRAGAMAKIDALVAGKLAEFRKTPTDNAIGILINSKIDDRPLNDDEILNMVTLLFFAGMDSTAGAISYAHLFLARHPEHRRILIEHLDDDTYMWDAAEELLRFHGFHHISRDVTRDAKFCGVHLKKGDTVVLPVQSANRDEARFPNALIVDFKRPNAKRHMTFGAGIHKCIGSHMATSQLRIALQEVHRVMPDYELVEPVSYRPGGPKTSPEALKFRYAPAR